MVFCVWLGGGDKGGADSEFGHFDLPEGGFVVSVGFCNGGPTQRFCARLGGVF